MKKLCSVFMIFALVLGLAACGSKNDGEGASQGTAPESSVQTAGEESSVEEDAGGTEASSDTQDAAQTEEPNARRTVRKAACHSGWWISGRLN